MDTIGISGFGAVTSDDALRSGLPFATFPVDCNEMPPNLRRRASLATLLAFSAAAQACRNAGHSPANLPCLFATVGGEIQVTDVLCRELAKDEGMISPTAFHNTVHNTAAAYWSIVHGCKAASSAVAGGYETFAMAMLEAWCQLATTGGELLLVCYDEHWPDYLAAPLGRYPFASAYVLEADLKPGGIARLGPPRRGPGAALPPEWSTLMRGAPVLAAIPLLAALESGVSQAQVSLAGTDNWVCNLTGRG